MSEQAKTENKGCHECQEWRTSNTTAACEDEAHQADQVCEDEVVGEEVGMVYHQAPPPASEASVDDDNTEREDQQDVGGSEYADADLSISGAKAP